MSQCVEMGLQENCGKDSCDFNTIQAMIDELKAAPEPMRPSKMWEELNAKNLQQLKDHGIENFRSTLACNYFTFCGELDQLHFLQKQLPWWTHCKNLLRAYFPYSSSLLSKKFMRLHTYYTHMLFDYVMTRVEKERFLTLEEALFGAPRIYRGEKLITADLANSVLEYESMREKIDCDSLSLVIELGAGYGRTASIFLQLHPHLRYVIVDIPPALYVAQTYLRQLFPERRHFSFRPFHRFEEIQEEWNEANICFLLPHQMALIPEKGVDLFINISSLHEMRLDQIAYYFQEINRLVDGYFYMKQWKKSGIPQEKVTIRQADYPILPGWKILYSRSCAVQTKFFEALYSI